ncbi:tyrosine-type recombinase/integrase [Streptomyces sp. c-19]|uniref:tyrosine-type recombinase/integrase n=1 Tax=Streptomyces sp. c-19 TaxID=2789275 RepID=UPI00397E958C
MKGRSIEPADALAARPLDAQLMPAAGPAPEARMFTGPRGGRSSPAVLRSSTAVLRDATHWDDVVTELGYGHLRRHDLRHTELTWFTDAGVQVHVLLRIAGHGSQTRTQRYRTPTSTRSRRLRCGHHCRRRQVR